MRNIKLIALLVICGFPVTSNAQFSVGTSSVDTSTIAMNLHVGWELIWGPDDMLWLTERNGYVTKVNPVTKAKKSILKINEVHEESESGLLGMALHPNFVDSPFVYLVYNYLSGLSIKEKLVRYTYASAPDTLTTPVTLLDNISGNSNHNGSRLLISPDRKLFMTTGDAQTGSFAQDLSRIEGKVLRMNLDGSVPADNPFAGSLVYTFGHRNPQGILLAPNGILYISEHGPNNDDEINILEKGRNYGWPTVMGYCNTSAEMTFCNANNVMEPIKAWTPTIATAGIDYYNNPAIPEWENSIIMATLKESDFRVLKLSDNGTAITSETVHFNNLFGRLRDVCVSPGGEIFITTSNQDGRGTPDDGDDRIIRIAVSIPIGIKKNEEPTVSVTLYPSVFNNQFNIELKNNENAATFHLYNIYGSEIKKISIDPNLGALTVERDNLASGMYFYSIGDHQKVFKTGRLIAK